MATTDMTESRLEDLIFASLTDASGGAQRLATRESLSADHAGYWPGRPDDYDPEHALDTAQLFAFLQSTQPEVIEQLDLGLSGVKRLHFLNRLQGEITKYGVTHVLRKGFSHGPVSNIRVYYYTPTPGNQVAAQYFSQNIFSVTRQLRYSRDESLRALDLVLFVNGLPVATMDVRNRRIRQTVADAVTQYKRDRHPRELLFQFARCLVHFALDDQEVRFCTHLQGNASWFLPFNKGYADGAGNPPVTDRLDGVRTDYLWREVLASDSFADIIQNYVQSVEVPHERGRMQRVQIFPRYHQLRAVRRLLDHADTHDVGQKYLIQHSAGSGKSNTIAWLAHMLVSLRQRSGVDSQPGTQKFDSIILITDRTALDRQIRETMRAFDHVASLIGHSDDSATLRRYLMDGKKIIITTLQKFPLVLDHLSGMQRSRRYAIIIDEAHSSQGGSMAAQMTMALSDIAAEPGENSDQIIARTIRQRQRLANASYFGFTATPKGETLELFGMELKVADQTEYEAFDTYTMKQAIQEGFIVDVLQNYTPVESYWRLAKAINDDPAFDRTRTLKRLRHYAERHSLSVRKKAEIMVDHFLEQVIGSRKIGGQARGMVVCDGVDAALEYFRAISAHLSELKSPYKAIVAFSGEREFAGRKVSESTLNGFPSSKLARNFKTDPYRLLVVANKFVTGFDEPLLHTMYVDKPLPGISAVQTLSRLNRAHPQKHDTFILDFRNSTDVIVDAFQDYYRTTILSRETDPDKLHTLKTDLDATQVYSWAQVEAVAALYVTGGSRHELAPILDACVAAYAENLNHDSKQIQFKSDAKKFCRCYSFLASILPYGHLEWEKLSIFLNLLVPKLPAPQEDDETQGVLEAIDIEIYRAEVRATIRLTLKDEGAQLFPPVAVQAGIRQDSELDKLSNIIKSFNEQFGNIQWRDGDKIRKVIEEELPRKVATDRAYQNAMRNSDRQNARVEHDKAIRRVILEMLGDHTELFRQFSDNTNFKRWLTDSLFDLTYRPQHRQLAGLPRFWLTRAQSVVGEQIGPAPKWMHIAEAIWKHFQIQLDSPVLLSDIERMSGDIGVSIADITAVLQVMSTCEPPLIARTFTQAEEQTGELREVGLGEVRQALSSLSDRGPLGTQADELANQVLLGWKPITRSEIASA